MTMPNNNNIFEAENLSCTFGHGKTSVTAIDNVSFTIADEEIVSLVGGSGCGKSVLAKIMLGIISPTSGKFLYKGNEIQDQGDSFFHGREDLKCLTKNNTYINQAPSSFNKRKKILSQYPWFSG